MLHLLLGIQRGEKVGVKQKLNLLGSLRRIRLKHSQKHFHETKRDFVVSEKHPRVWVELEEIQAVWSLL